MGGGVFWGVARISKFKYFLGVLVIPDILFYFFFFGGGGAKR